MPCFKVGENGFSTPASGSLFMGAYATEAECLQACKEGACCESNGTCSVKPQCQCQGAGQTFRGVGTVCTGPLPQALPLTLTLQVSGVVGGSWGLGSPPAMAGTFTLNRSTNATAWVIAGIAFDTYTYTIRVVSSCSSSVNSFSYHITVSYNGGLSGLYTTFQGRGVAHPIANGCCPEETISLTLSDGTGSATFRISQT